MKCWTEYSGATVRVGSHTLYEDEIKDALKEGKYLVGYRTIYQPRHGKNSGYHLDRLYEQPDKQNTPLTLRGRYCWMSAEEINAMLGWQLLHPLPTAD